MHIKKHTLMFLKTEMNLSQMTKSSSDSWELVNTTVWFK